MVRLKLVHFKNYIEILKDTFNGFIDDRGLKLSASLAYYTIFSLAPMLIILMSVADIFYRKEALQGEVFAQLDDFVGADAAKQVQDTLQKLAFSGKSTIAIVTGIITLLIGATGIFIEIQDSINQIWRVKAIPKKGWVKFILDRVLSLSMIGALGFLLIVSLLINSVVLLFSQKLGTFLPDFTLVFVDIINLIITFGVLIALFAIIYKVLPDAEIPWRDVIAGAIFTAFLFLLGKYLIGLYIAFTAVASIYGAAGTVVVIAVWVYYSAAILFFGAEFTRAYAKFKGEEIKPSKIAVSVKQIEIEQGKKPIELKI